MHRGVMNRISRIQLVLQIMLIILQWHRQRLSSVRSRYMLAAHHLINLFSILSHFNEEVLTSQEAFVQLSQLRAPRRWWVYPRPANWRRFVMRFWGDEQWLENFRMTQATFMWIADRLRTRLQPSYTAMREPLSVEERLAITLWYLSNTICYRVIGQAFGVARSTVAVIVIEVCLVMRGELYEAVVHPGPPGLAMQGFLDLGFPQCVGAIDCTHVYIRAPEVDPEAYIDRHQRYSVIVQAIVDNRGYFVDTVVGHVGRDHDAHVLRCSNVFDAMNRGVWVPGNPTIIMDGVNIPPLILGDGAYPLRSWLMTPYKGNLSPDQALYNRTHSRCRNVVERAFGRLKARWRCLLLQLPLREENLNTVIVACLILHNICEDRGHRIIGGSLTTNRAPLPHSDEDPAALDNRQQQEGGRVRDAIKRWISRHRGRQ